MNVYNISIPEDFYRRLQRQAAAERRSVDELVEQTLIRQLPTVVPIEEDLLEEDLSPLLKEELQAMAHLSDAALWSLARSTLTIGQEDELDELQQAFEERGLTVEEIKRRTELMREYDDRILRRAHAAVLLQNRGYDISDPAVLSQ